MQKDTSSRKVRIRKQKFSRSVKTLKPVGRAFTRQGRAFFFTFTDNQTFTVRLDLRGVVNSRSAVFVSISEIGIFNGQLKPFLARV